MGETRILAAAPRKGRPRYQLAVKYHMIEQGRSVRERFDVLKRARFDGVEITVKQKPQVKELLRASAQTSIRIHGVVEGQSDNYEPAIDLCDAVGGTSVLITAREHPGMD